MKFYKIISVILHPIVVPIIGVLLYFLVIPHRVSKEQQFVIVSIIFVTTYLIPLSFLLFLKNFKFVNSYQVKSIQERKGLLIFMIILFYLLSSFFFRYTIINDLGSLFYATTFSLGSIYILFIFKIKTSLHLLSIGNLLGFFFTLSIYYAIYLTPIFIVLIFIAGILASARLHLKAHKTNEIYIGFFLGIVSQFLVFYFYKI